MKNAKSSECKRINVKLDQNSFDMLMRIKKRRGYSTYTQAVKKAIASLNFIDENEENGLVIYMGKVDGVVKQVIFMP